MQPLDGATKHSSLDSECASLVVETVLLGMRAIRRQIRAHKPRELTVQQFRVLAHLRHHAGASLSHLAEHAGLALPSMSKAVDHLVKQGLVERAASTEDRRRVNLQLTQAGRSVFEATDCAVKAGIANLLAALPPVEREDIARGVAILRSAFEQSGASSCPCAKQ